MSAKQSPQITPDQKITWWWRIGVLDDFENEIYHLSSKPDTFFSLERCKQDAIDFATNKLTKKINERIELAQKEVQEFTEILKVINGEIDE